MSLKNYQEKAIGELLEKSKKLLGYGGGKKLVFKSPTGSGKTLMVAEFLKKLVDDREIRTPLSFVWAAPRHLHEQSKEKLEQYYEDNRALECSYFEDLNDRRIGESEILFFNWESINKKGNLYIRDNEKENNLSNILARTRGEGRKIILIIDESHYSSGQMDKKEKSAATKLRDDIGADLTLEVSATPLLVGDEMVNVYIEDVKDEGMIKKSVVLNEDFKNIFTKGKIKTDLAQSTEKVVIEQALRKQKELTEMYKKLGADVNPLILIQLPDRKTNTEDALRERVEKILDSHGINVKKQTLGIHLSGDHENLEGIEKNDSEIKVLIFKQAVALGWDCPRAQIMALFRQWHSAVFSIQTVGRIMRMPEPDKGHYESDILNHAYVYTNLDNIDIAEDVAKKYITVFESKRIKNYEPINLTSYHSVRQREKTRLAPIFINIFVEAAKRYGLKSKINKKAKKIKQGIISDWRSENINLGNEGLQKDDSTSYKMGLTDLQKYFDYFARKSLRHFYPEDRSVEKVKLGIYAFFKNEYKMDYAEVEEEIVPIVLSEKNSQHFVNVVSEAEDEYLKQVSDREKELAADNKWNVPEFIRYNENYVEDNYKKSVMRPFYDGQLTAEKSFIKFLDKSDNVEWWFKNGDRDAVFFAVPYKIGSDVMPFYVDFVVKLKDGRIGLFDTKGDLTLQAGGPKMDGLCEYIKNESKKNRKLFGGLVVNTETGSRGRWIYFDGQSKNFKQGYFSNWKDVEL